jgi:putative transposase
MANTYTQLHFQLIFAVKYRQALIDPSWEEQLHKYISGIIMEYKHKLICINGTEDHIHIVIGYRPTQLLPDLLKEIKENSSKWINKNYFTSEKFEWQGGYGAFSYSKSDLPKLIKYVMNQKEHHRKMDFEKEYLLFLKLFDVEFEEKYVLKNPISKKDDKNKRK